MLIFSLLCCDKRSDKVPLTFSIYHCRDRVKSVATVFLTFFFNNVATKELFIATEMLFLPLVQHGLCCDIRLLAATLFFKSA